MRGELALSKMLVTAYREKFSCFQAVKDHKYKKKKLKLSNIFITLSRVLITKINLFSIEIKLIFGQIETAAF